MDNLKSVLVEGLLLLCCMQFSNLIVNWGMNLDTAPVVTVVEADVPVAPSATPLPPDPRRAKLLAYFSTFDCPLSGYVDNFLAIADQTGLDWRLLPAISMQESTCGKYLLGNNPFGFGYKSFDSIESSITYVGDSISGGITQDSGYYIRANRDSRQILQIYNTRPSYPDDVIAKMSAIDSAR